MKIWTDKTTWGAGELSPQMARRSDTQQHADGAKRMRNVRALNAGGFSRRPGSLHIRTLLEHSRLIEFTFAVDQEYLLVFSPGRMDAFLADGTPAGFVSGAPWTAGDVQVMTWVQSGDTVFLASRGWHPQVLRRTGAAAWTLDDWAADLGPGDTLLQPYYKFAEITSRIQPTAGTGTVEVHASAYAFHAEHVGRRIRYVGREIAITAVTSPFQATGTVLQDLPPSQRLALETPGGFDLTHIVEGEESAAKGEIVFVNTETDQIDVVIVDGMTPFVLNETIVSPRGKSKIIGLIDIDPGPVRDWDEPYLSPVYGYPAAVGLHRQRLWFGGHTLLPSSVLASRVGAHGNFDLGTGEDAEAIFEDLGDSAVAWVRHFASAENLLILTDQGAYYVPESAANPLRPSSIAFHKVGPHGCSYVRPAAFDDGWVYQHISGAGVMSITATGDATRPWKGDDLALLASHLIRTPTDLAATHGRDGSPERYAFACNSDGTLAVMHSIQSQQVLGWSLWETDGLYQSVAVLGGRVFAVVQREFTFGRRWCLERFDQALTTDGAELFPAGTGTSALYAGTAPAARSGTSYYGPLALPGSGVIPDLELDGAALELGRFFRPTVECLPPEPKLPAGGSAARVRRIARIRLCVLDALRVRVGDRIMEAHRLGEDVTAAPPARTEWIEAGLLGRSREPTITITQDECLPMTVLGVSMEVIL